VQRDIVEHFPLLLRCWDAITVASIGFWTAVVHRRVRAHYDDDDGDDDDDDDDDDKNAGGLSEESENVDEFKDGDAQECWN
jgi:hypothetical protein